MKTYGENVGWVDRIIPVGVVADNNSRCFTMLYQFFNGPMASSSYSELISLNYGASGTGTDFTGDGNPFGENAWAVFKIPSGSVGGQESVRGSDLYYLIQWADSSNFGTAPGNPGLLGGGVADGVGISVAWRDDGTSPWLGTTAANGSDTKGATVWGPGSSTLRCYPKSNTINGNHNSLKQNMARFCDLTSTNLIHRFNAVADRDNIYFWITIGADLTQANIHFHGGVYEPLQELSASTPTPGLFYINSNAGPGYIDNTTYGSTAGNLINESMVCPPSSSVYSPIVNEASRWRMDRYVALMENATNVPLLSSPSQILGNSYPSYKWPIFLYDTPDYGHVGYVEATPEISFLLPRYSVNAASSSMAIGPDSANPKMLYPWSGSFPTSVSTFAGRHWEQ